MVRKNDRSGWAIGLVAVLMLAGGGWALMKHYQRWMAKRAFLAEVGALAQRWSDVRWCLTNAPPGSDEDAEALALSMVRARDRSLALAPPSAHYPFTCFSEAHATLEELSALRPPEAGAPVPGPYETPFADDDGRRPFSFRELRALAALVMRVDADVASLWSSYGGEGSPFPEATAPVAPWDEEVLPAFVRGDDCPTTAVNLSIGADDPLADAARVGGTLYSFRARPDGQIEVRDEGADAPVVVARGASEEDAWRRLRACGAASSSHLVLATESSVHWIALGPEHEVLSREQVGDEALAVALRGEDGREVHLACSDDGPTLAYAGDAEARLFECSLDRPEGTRCAAPVQQPIGPSRLGLARVGGRSMLLRYPPGSRVAVVEAFDVGAEEPVGPLRVVPTMDDRANPELDSDGTDFVLTLCGVELRAAASELRWEAAESD